MILLGSLASMLLLAAAGEGPALRFEGCADRQINGVKGLVAVELAGKPLADSTKAEIFCRGSRALVMVSGQGEPLARWVDLRAGGAQGRARLLALTIAELVSAQQAMPQSSLPAEEKPPVPPTPDESPQVTDVPEPAQLRLNAAGQVRAFPGGLMLLGIGGEVARGSPGRIGWRADLLLEGGLAARSLGQVEASAAGLGLAALWQIARVGSFDVEAATGLRGGYARLEGVPIDPWLPKQPPTQGAWLGPFLALRMCYARGWLGIELGAEAGVVLLPLRAGITAPEEAGISGGWLGLQLGVGVLP